MRTQEPAASSMRVAREMRVAVELAVVPVEVAVAELEVATTERADGVVVDQPIRTRVGLGARRHGGERHDGERSTRGPNGCVSRPTGRSAAAALISLHALELASARWDAVCR